MHSGLREILELTGQNLHKDKLNELAKFQLEVDESPTSVCRKLPSGLMMKFNIHILVGYLHEIVDSALIDVFMWLLNEESSENLDLYLP